MIVFDVANDGRKDTIWLNGWDCESFDLWSKQLPWTTNFLGLCFQIVNSIIISILQGDSAQKDLLILMTYLGKIIIMLLNIFILAEISQTRTNVVNLVYLCKLSRLSVFPLVDFMQLEGLSLRNGFLHSIVIRFDQFISDSIPIDFETALHYF